MRYLSLLLLFPFAVYAKVIGYIEHEVSKERIEFHDESKNCPKDTLYATYSDPRDGEKAEGCYIVEGNYYIVAFRTGSYAMQPLQIPKRAVKTYT